MKSTCNWREKEREEGAMGNRKNTKRGRRGEGKKITRHWREKGGEVRKRRDGE